MREITAIQAVNPDTYTLDVVFDGVEVVTLDFSHYVARNLEKNWVAPMAQKDFFRQVQLVDGNLSWPNDLDFCAEALYRKPKV